MKTILGVLYLLLLCSCTRTQYVPVESKAVSLSADSLERMIRAMAMGLVQTEHSQRVSLVEKAVYTLNEAGDTIHTLIERERDTSTEWHTKEAYYLSVIDSLKQKTSRVDSVYIEKPVPVEVVKEVNVLRWWQKGLCWIGGIAIFAILAFIGLQYLRKRR